MDEIRGYDSEDLLLRKRYSELEKKCQEQKEQIDCKSNDINVCPCYENKGFPCYRHLDSHVSDLEQQLAEAKEKIRKERIEGYSEGWHDSLDNNTKTLQERNKRLVGILNEAIDCMEMEECAMCHKTEWAKINLIERTKALLKEGES